MGPELVSRHPEVASRQWRSMFLKYLRSFLLKLGAEPRGRALAQNGEWAYPVVSGLFCLLSLYSLIGMNFSDPGILNRGAFKQDPETVYMARVNGRLYHMPWCPTCYFHRLPRTFHCKRCDICVEEFDHHCRWVNNCVGRRNIRLYLLLLVSLCLYLGTVLATCVVFIICRRNVAFLDKIMTILVAVPTGALLVPLILQLFIKAVAVGTARRPYEEKGMPEQGAQLPQTFRVLKGKPTEHPLAVRGVNKYYNASTLKKKNLRFPPTGETSDSGKRLNPMETCEALIDKKIISGKIKEKDCFPFGTPALNTKVPDTLAIIMEENDGDGEVRPFTAPGHGHTRPGMQEQGAQLPQTFRVLKGKPMEHPLAVRGVNKYYNASTLKKKNLRFPPTGETSDSGKRLNPMETCEALIDKKIISGKIKEKDCFPSGTPELNTKVPDTLAIIMEENDGDGEVQPFTVP
ncbi:uncharacterized protein LOC144374571 isoform X1 [Ictidomys tridecemlineatus]